MCPSRLYDHVPITGERRVINDQLHSGMKVDCKRVPPSPAVIESHRLETDSGR